MNEPTECHTCGKEIEFGDPYVKVEFHEGFQPLDGVGLGKVSMSKLCSQKCFSDWVKKNTSHWEKDEAH